jgi:Golgi nucleoside diphosphatase
MSETAKEIFYLLSFSVGSGFLLSKTVFSLMKIWQDDQWLEKGRSRRFRP